MNREKVNCRLEYEAQDSPKCKVLINDEVVHTFTGNGSHDTFSFIVDKGPFKFKIVHHGKDIKKDTDRFIEIKKIFFNNIDFKNMIWKTTQVAELPKWQNKEDFQWESNLYLGHNGYIEYTIESPVIEFLLSYHTAGAKVSSNMGSYDMRLLYEMKEYFSKIVYEQDRNG